MKIFLLKVNPKNCPAKISRPVCAGDWEKHPFEMPSLATMSGGTRYKPASDDIIEIWVSERPRDRSTIPGKGYTGRAVVSKIKERYMWVKNIEISDPPLGAKIILPIGGSVLNWISVHRHPRIVLMNDEEAKEFTSAIIQAHEASVLLDNENSLSADDASTDVFDPSNVTDGRNRIVRSIAERRGQKAFRDTLRAAYVNRCATSNCDVLDVLEAAHICPYRGPETNSVTNGLLLRSDLHTLFDCGLIAIDPENFRVSVAVHLRKSDYGRWHGSTLRIPSVPGYQPSKAALSTRFQIHVKNIQKS